MIQYQKKPAGQTTMLKAIYAALLTSTSLVSDKSDVRSSNAHNDSTGSKSFWLVKKRGLLWLFSLLLTESGSVTETGVISRDTCFSDVCQLCVVLQKSLLQPAVRMTQNDTHNLNAAEGTTHHQIPQILIKSLL